MIILRQKLYAHADYQGLNFEQANNLLNERNNQAKLLWEQRKVNKDNFNNLINNGLSKTDATNVYNTANTAAMNKANNFVSTQRTNILNNTYNNTAPAVKTTGGMSWKGKVGIGLGAGLLAGGLLLHNNLNSGADSVKSGNL